MGRKAKELKPLQVSRLTTEGLHFVGGVPGLALQIGKTPEARSWILRVLVAGKRRDIGLGGYPAVGLADAREAARAARAKIRNGVDPIAERKALRAALQAERLSAWTFRQCADAYIAAKESEWKNLKHGSQWRNTLDTYVHPKLGQMLVRDVGQEHVLTVLEPIWKTKTETATRVRGRIESILDWATVRKYRRGDNPARWKGHLDVLLPAPEKVTKTEHHAALPYSEIGAFVAELRQQEGLGARALEFTILTAARSGEVRGATLDEINLDKGVWTIPAGRMKAGKEHQIPLSQDAIALIRSVSRIDGSNLLFPNTRGMPLSDMTLSAVLRRMGRDFTVHGMRSTFRDWAGETTAYPREVIEHALAHQLKDKAEAAYARGTLFDKRRRLMADWAKFCNTVAITGTVTPINALQGV